MFRSKLSRLYELKDLIADPSSPVSYFQNFDEKLRDSKHIMDVYVGWERVLQCLDEQAWLYLKNEAVPYLMVWDRGRGWQSLFDILNQAHAYDYLKRLGCQEIAFISRRAQRTPDLEAWLGESRLLCEVKTLNISDEEVRGRMTVVARSIAICLGGGFFRKLLAAIEQARQQLAAYDPSRSARHIVYVSPRFDDILAECKERYFQQIDQYLIEQAVEDVEIVMHNARTPFHMPVYMRAATVDNAA
jgi:hypothetical protein